MAKLFIKTEQEAAALVVEYLHDMGLDIYQEVTIDGVVADIVALRNREVWIIETKMTWSLDLLAQCAHHVGCGHAHRVFAAVPSSRNDPSRSRLFLHFDIGTITIRNSPEEWSKKTQVAEMAPRITHKPLPHIIGRLKEGHKTHAKAGAPCAGGRYTPWRGTCDALTDLVNTMPGITMKEAMTRIKHHYSSDACARGSMLAWVQCGKIPGVKAHRQGRIFQLYPVDWHIPVPMAHQDPIPGLTDSCLEST